MNSGPSNRGWSIINVFSVCSDKMFSIDDTDVGELSAVKIRLAKIGLYEDYWQLRQVGPQSS